MITTGLTLSAKTLLLELLSKESFKLALYEGTADVGPTSTFYTSVGEVRGQGYKAGGLPLKGARVWSERECAYLSWDSPVIPVATIAANGFMIYIPNRANVSIFVGAWNSTFTSTEGPFRVNIAADQIGLE